MYRGIFVLLLSTTNAFMVTPKYYKRPNLLNIEMNYKPQELLQSLGKGQLGHTKNFYQI